ncbi:hypothetical protein [Streptomyces cyanogenus]|uniref:Uncharacterized protein n=1 Tax=Streptomyces cyanogenus TaxID=80860 RepID=A0ABX7U6F7_STRCY|nr:hypothetical protein [Streptomyces cyanogenus]QTD95759.1 hypothetical protein S1361_00300 [Streptomyces cyanogenus]QTE03231.1 hypothetical protein S1361_38200 [Streptomyces cyanogenus]
MSALEVYLRLYVVIVIIVVTAPVRDWGVEWQMWAAIGLTACLHVRYLRLRF